MLHGANISGRLGCLVRAVHRSGWQPLDSKEAVGEFALFATSPYALSFEKRFHIEVSRPSSVERGLSGSYAKSVAKTLFAVYCFQKSNSISDKLQMKISGKTFFRLGLNMVRSLGLSPYDSKK